MRKTMMVLAIAFAGNATAVIPDSGWYFNQNESGRGFSVEIQNNTLFMAGFIYDDTGNQIWVVSGGPMSSDHTYSGDAFLTTNGQPLGGTYREPTSIPFGTVQITWSDTTNAFVVVNGRGFNVTRQLFGFDFSSNTQPLLGELSFVEGANTFFGDRITMTGTKLLNGAVWATGNKTGNAARLAVGRYEPSLRLWTILLDSSSLYYDYFTFRFEGVNFVEGSDYTYLKTSTPTTSLPTVGYRTKSAQRAAGQNAPGSEKDEVRDKAAEAKIAVRSGPALPAEQLVHVHALEDAMRALRVAAP